MDLAVHNRILWYACAEASRRLNGNWIDDPRKYFPVLVRGSWMNDMNQATIFTHKIIDATDKNATVNADLQVKAFFRLLWIEEMKDLLSDMRQGSGESLQAADSFGNTYNEPDSVDGFGIYSRYDHLDVLSDKVENEYPGTDENHARSNTIKHTCDVKIEQQLLYSTFEKERSQRLDVSRVTALGRSLHTMADFFAHSNYVELLLWSLAWDGRLEQWIVDEFNQQQGFLADRDNKGLYCPLPSSGDGARKGTAEDAILWYGPSPEHTPLSSSLFDTRDTAYSILNIYAAHLEKVDDKSFDNDTLDLAMAIFDVPGRILISKVWNIYQQFNDALRSIGHAARHFLAGVLDRIGGSYGSQVKGILGACASIIREYDSAEAKDWARAGRFKYTAYILEHDMAKEYYNQKPDKPLLPHHSILNKDTLPSGTKDVMRFQLACLFAAEITAEMIKTHFSLQRPTATDYRGLAEKYLVHPWFQHKEGIIDRENLSGWINRSSLSDWPNIMHPNANVIR